MEIQILRAIERILVVAVGGLSIYLGYLVFLHIPDRLDSEGKVVLPGGISIYLSRVGPGAFFALFGGIVVALSFLYPLRTSEELTGISAEGTPAQRTVSTTYFGGLGAPVDRQTLEAARLRIGSMMIFLNGDLPTRMKSGLSEAEREDLQRTIRQIRLELIRAAWSVDWGDREALRAFEDWVFKGAAGPPPKGLGEPAALFNRGQRR